MKYTVSIEQDEMADSPDMWGNEDLFLLVGDSARHWPTIKREGISAYDVLDRKRYEWKGNKYYVFPAYATGGYSPINLLYAGEDHANAAVLVKVSSFTRTRAKAMELAESLIEEWRMFSEGEVYVVLIYDEQDNVVFSLGGVYGYAYAKETAEEELAALQQADKEEMNPLELVYN